MDTGRLPGRLANPEAAPPALYGLGRQPSCHRISANGWLPSTNPAEYEIAPGDKSAGFHTVGVISNDQSLSIIGGIGQNQRPEYRCRSP